MINRLRSNTNILMNSAVFLPLPSMLGYFFMTEHYFLITSFALLLALLSKFVPYFSAVKGHYYYKYSPFLPAVPIDTVEINRESIKINGKTRLIYQYENSSGKSYILNTINALKTNNSTMHVEY